MSRLRSPLAVVLVASLLLPVAARAAPRVPYVEGTRVPPGYHVTSRPRVGLVIVGGILCLLSALGVGVGVDGVSRRDDTAEVAGFAFAGLTAAPGIPLLMVGLLKPKHYLVADHAWRLRLAPATAGVRGVSLTLEF